MEEEIKKADACWSIQLNVNCPHCDYWLDIISECDDSWETIPEPGISEKNHNRKYTCWDCNQEFIVENIYY